MTSILSLIKFRILILLVNKMAPKLEVFIMCRDRPEYAKLAISSAVKNLTYNSSLTISDNSTSDFVQCMVMENFPNIKYVRRNPPLDSQEHFSEVIRESLNSEYAIIFHDDDVMSDGYVTSMLDYLDMNQSVSAVACNATIINEDGENTGRYFFSTKDQPTLIENPTTLIKKYLSMMDPSRPPPFPSYCYRTKYLDEKYVNHADGGKHSDVALLVNVLKNAPFIWLSTPLISYRIHSCSDSSQEKIADRLSLLRYIFSNKFVSYGDMCVLEYKLYYWYRFMRSKFRDKCINIFNISKRDVIVTKFLLISSIRLAICKKNFWLTLYKKLVN